MPSKPLDSYQRLRIIAAVVDGVGPLDDDARLVLVNMVLFSRVHTTDDGEPAGIQYRGGTRRLALPFQAASSAVVPDETIELVDGVVAQLAADGFIELLAEAVPPRRRGRQGNSAHWRIHLG